jgi:hypothetical protein
MDIASIRRLAWKMALVSALAAGSHPGIGGAGQPQPADFPLAPPVRFVTNVALSEDTQSSVGKSFKTIFLDAVRALDWERAGRGLTEDFQGRFPRPADGHLIEDDKLSIRRYEPDGLSVLGRDEFLAAIRAHAADWTSIERLSSHVFEFLLDPGLGRAFLKTHFELGGARSGGGRGILHATMAVQLVETAPGQWAIRRWDLVEGTRVDNPSPPFRDITDAVGFHFNRSEANGTFRQDIIDTRASLIDSALSVVDWNRDGFWDLIATESMNHSVLFRNDGKGGFVTEPLPVTDRRLFPGQFLFVDLDNDGLEELVGNRVIYFGDRAWMGVHTRRNGQWVFLPRALEFANPPGLVRSDAQSMTAGDVNGDGWIDVFVAGYENNRSREPNRFNRVNAHDGDDNLLFINHGGLRFTEESDSRGIKGTQYTYVAQFFDFDADGDLDLFEGNDYGRNVVWDNQGRGTFRALEDHPFGRNPNYSMGITIGDWDNTGDWGVYISNMYSHAGNRVVRVTDTLSERTRAQLKIASAGNQLFARRSGVWQEQAVALAADEAGWAWANLFYDVDNDGDKEIFVANGNTSYRDPAAPDY